MGNDTLTVEVKTLTVKVTFFQCSEEEPHLAGNNNPGVIIIIFISACRLFIVQITIHYFIHCLQFYCVKTTDVPVKRITQINDSSLKKK